MKDFSELCRDIVDFGQFYRKIFTTFKKFSSQGARIFFKAGLGKFFVLTNKNIKKNKQKSFETIFSLVST